jgi:hypothetical protein
VCGILLPTCIAPCPWLYMLARERRRDDIKRYGTAIGMRTCFSARPRSRRGTSRPSPGDPGPRGKHSEKPAAAYGPIERVCRLVFVGQIASGKALIARNIVPWSMTSSNEVATSGRLGAMFEPICFIPDTHDRPELGCGTSQDSIPTSVGSDAAAWYLVA